VEVIILDDLELNYLFSFEDVFVRDKIKEKKFLFSESKGYFLDIGTPEDYARA
jgi:NDP-sugar pyrophosphorylase family protein